MSRPFAKYPANPTFAKVKEPNNASDYIAYKKTRNSFCLKNVCIPNRNLYSESNYLMYKRANNYITNPCSNYNKSQLYTNLYTKMVLNDEIPIITDISGNTFPVIIDTSVAPYTKYCVDPNGVLFGKSVCGLENFLHFVQPNISSTN